MTMHKYLTLDPEEHLMLDRAMEREDWDVVALWLLLGAIRKVQSLPPDGLEDFLDEIAAEPAGHRRSVARRRRDGHSR